MADGGMNRSALAFGIFFVLGGVAFLLDRLDVWDLRARYLLPSLLVALGVAILVGGRAGGSDSPAVGSGTPETGTPDSGTPDSGGAS
ncbi:MAG: DUF5668 domain-containing protein [Actinomycetota bacterium]